MDQIFSLYSQFLSNFPDSLHPFISLILAVLLVIGIIKVIRKDFIYLILLIILLPASIPILRNVWQALYNIIIFLIGKK